MMKTPLPLASLVNSALAAVSMSLLCVGCGALSGGLSKAEALKSSRSELFRHGVKSTNDWKFSVTEDIAEIEMSPAIPVDVVAVYNPSRSTRTPSYKIVLRRDTGSLYNFSEIDVRSERRHFR